MSAAPRIAANVLAAGFSKRFGKTDKLSASLGKNTLLEKSLAAYASPLLTRKIIVLQADSPHAETCSDAGFEIIVNQNAERGMGSSIACAIAALDDTLDDTTHALIGLADMPDIEPQTIDYLCRAVETDAPSHSIIIPTHDGQRGNPRLFSATHFPLLAQLSGDKGAKSIIAACPNILDFAVHDAGILRDVDTVEALETAAISS